MSVLACAARPVAELFYSLVAVETGISKLESTFIGAQRSSFYRHPGAIWTPHAVLVLVGMMTCRARYGTTAACVMLVVYALAGIADFDVREAGGWIHMVSHTDQRAVFAIEITIAAVMTGHSDSRRRSECCSTCAHCTHPNDT